MTAELSPMTLAEAREALGSPTEAAARKRLSRAGITAGYDRRAVEALAAAGQVGRGFRTDLRNAAAVAARQAHLDALPLPAGTQLQYFTGTDARGCLFEHIAVWADRPYAACPDCGEDVDVVPGSPVVPNPGLMGGEPLSAVNQQHCCGTWLSVHVRELPGDATDEAVLAAATELAGIRAEELEQGRARIRAELRRQVRAAVDAFVEADQDDYLVACAIEEHLTGTDTEPGVYRRAEDGLLAAWAYGPLLEENDLIIVVEEEDPCGDD